MNKLIIILSIFANGCQASNILVVLPIPILSHVQNFMSIFSELAIQGHNVTILNAYPLKEEIPNLTHIKLDNFIHKLYGKVDHKEQTFDYAGGLHFKMIGWWNLLNGVSELTLEQKPIQNLINDTTSSYDLIIIETFFGQESFLALGHKYDAPIITVHPYIITFTLAQFTGNPTPLSYVPSERGSLSNNMSFLERVENTFFYLWDVYVAYPKHLAYQESLMRKYFKYPGSGNIPSLHDLLKTPSLTFVESIVSMRYPRPLQSNMIEIGGINLKDSEKLPPDLQSFMDNAADGVIYLSFGSHIRTSLFGAKANVFLSALGKLKQKVLMKWEDISMPNKSDNIILSSWFPQTGIFAHPNCKIFISHGGLHGVTEAIYHGIPIIGIPIFSDQVYNLKVVEAFGAAINLQLNELSEDKLIEAIDTILSNTEYKLNAEKRKALIRDQPMDPLNKAIYWINYVLRHHGASHLRPAELDIPLYQYFLIDVAIFFIALIGISLTCLIYICMALVQILLRAKKRRALLIRDKIENKSKDE